LYEDGKLYFKTKNEEKSLMEHYHYDTFALYNKSYNCKELIGFKANLHGEITQIACYDDENVMLREN
jgi:hypothetical protein